MMGCASGKQVAPVSTQNTVSASLNENASRKEAVGDGKEEFENRHDSGVPTIDGLNAALTITDTLSKEQCDFFRMLDAKVDEGDDFDFKSLTDSFKIALDEVRQFRATRSRSDLPLSRSPSLCEGSIT